jgi:2',3'-cyclic-nucleotide 2'-phosphodiesterase/3'-nucleotidase
VVKSFFCTIFKKNVFSLQGIMPTRKIKKKKYQMQKLLFFTLIIIACWGCSTRQKSLEIVVTTDIHGNIFAYPDESGTARRGSLSKVAYLVDSLRNANPNLLIFDNGDLLQGTPDVYYFNFIDTAPLHPIISIMRHIGFNAASVGNHDIECGPTVYKKLQTEFKHPWLAANIVSKETGEPAFQPYTIIERLGLKIAVLGLITPGVPKWLPEPLWEGLEFEDMISSSKKWMDVIKEKEKPDFVIGLFHSGWNPTCGGGDSLQSHNENASLLVARQVEGFDIIFVGHDHQEKVFRVANPKGKTVTVVDCGFHARSVGRVSLTRNKSTLSIDSAWVENILALKNSDRYDNEFIEAKEKSNSWKESAVCIISEPIYTTEALFGPSAYLNLIHKVQLKASGADISIATPLSVFNFTSSDTLRQTDMFILYPFENMLYTLQLTGAEIVNILEYSANLWFNSTFPQGTLLKYAEGKEYKVLANPSFNFATAGGVSYVVDFRPTAKKRIHSLKLHNGKPFNQDLSYSVAINSYQASGGGGHLSIGAGLSKEEIKSRTVKIFEKEIRVLVTEYLHGLLRYEPDYSENWKIEPVKEWKKQVTKESSLLYK